MIVSLGKIDNDLIAFAIGRVVLLQFRAEPACLNPDNWINARVIVAVAAKHFRSDCVFFEQNLFIIDRLLDDETQERF